MTVILMSRSEIDRMTVLRDLVEDRIRVSEAATLMGLGRRQVFRLAKAFLNPPLLTKPDVVNTRAWRAAEIGGGNAHTTARSLAPRSGSLSYSKVTVGMGELPRGVGRTAPLIADPPAYFQRHTRPVGLTTSP